MRRVLRSAVLVVAASALGAPPATAWAEQPPQASDFEQRIPSGDAHAAGGAARRWTTPPLRAPRRFDLLGVRWRGGDADVELRVLGADGRWSRWVQAPHGEQPPARRSGATHATGPVWTGGGERYQLRATRPLRDARAHFVAVEGSRRAVPAVAAAGARPAIVPRSAWDPGNACPPRVTPSYGRVDFAMVHHTVSLNAYGPGDTPAMVLAICRFHRNANQWNDIGYDLLVDRYGVVYEGRLGGIAEPVIGAQAQGWNAVSTGVAAIGDFSGGGLPAGALHVLARTIAWKLSLAGVPAEGSIAERSIGGDVNRYQPGVRVRFQRISGHRDGDLTACPGNGLYAQLPALRELTTRLLPAPRDLLTISPAPAPQPAGGPVLLTGRLARADGRRPAGAPIVLQQRQAGAWTDLVTVVSGADGIWSAALPLAQNAELRALHVSGGIASPAVAIPVQAGVRLRAARRTVRLGQPLVLTGVTSPAKARVRVLVERRPDEGSPRFQRVKLHALSTVEGRFALTLRLPTTGTYRIAAATPTDRVNASGRSRPLRVRVR
jgi:hypothetical protein